MKVVLFRGYTNRPFMDISLNNLMMEICVGDILMDGVAGVMRIFCLKPASRSSFAFLFIPLPFILVRDSETAQTKRLSKTSGSVESVFDESLFKRLHSKIGSDSGFALDSLNHAVSIHNVHSDDISFMNFLI
jgi:hypothetical protein